MYCLLNLHNCVQKGVRVHLYGFEYNIIWYDNYNYYAGLMFAQRRIIMVVDFYVSHHVFSTGISAVVESVTYFYAT